MGKALLQMMPILLCASLINIDLACNSGTANASGANAIPIYLSGVMAHATPGQHPHTNTD